jgi:hypothetical protein
MGLPHVRRAAANALLRSLIFYPEDRGDTFLRNVDSYNIHAAPHTRRRHSSLCTCLLVTNASSFKTVKTAQCLSAQINEVLSKQADRTCDIPVQMSPCELASDLGLVIPSPVTLTCGVKCFSKNP